MEKEEEEEDEEKKNKEKECTRNLKLFCQTTEVTNDRDRLRGKSDVAFLRERRAFLAKQDRDRKGGGYRQGGRAWDKGRVRERGRSGRAKER